MKKNEKKEQTALHRNNPNVLGLRADVVEQRITDTLTMLQSGGERV